MSALFKFFVRYGNYLLFIFLEVIALVVAAHGGAFQRSKFYALSHGVASRVYAIREEVTHYIGLSSANEQLSVENSVLRTELFRYKQLYQQLSSTGDSVKRAPLDPTLTYESFAAKVINNSVGAIDNYMTLNRGKLDGIDEDMSVIAAGSAVGVVESVSDHFAIVLPLLNPKAQLSCKIAGKNTDSLGTSHIKDIGSLVWKGGDTRFAHLEKVPRHVPLKKGDKVITSGYSDFFPEGLQVGEIEQFGISNDDNYYDIVVRLSVNFRQLEHVEVLNYKYGRELRTLQDSIHVKKNEGGKR